MRPTASAATRITGPGVSPPALEEAERDGLRRRLQWLMGGRLIVVTVLLGGTLLIAAHPVNGTDAFTPALLLGLIIATYAASIGYALLLPRAGSLRTFAAVQLAWDLILTSGLVYVSGGLASGFTFLYGIEILLATLIVGPRATQAVALASLLVYTVLGISVANGWMPQPPDQPAGRYLLSVEATSFALMSNIVGLLLVTILASNLATRLRRTGGELQRAAESVANLARLNDDIVRSLLSGVLTTDLDGRIVTVNPAAAQMFGVDPTALGGRPVDGLLPLGEGISVSERGRRGEGRALRPDGGGFPVGFTQNPLLDSDGTVTGTLVTFQDLTEIRELEEAAEHAERLATLGRLAAGLAHEIRNPLGSISGSVELVKEARGLEEEDRQLLQIVLSEVERLNDLVTTMLQVGRPRPPARIRRDVSRLVSNVVQMAERDQTMRGDVRIETRGTDEPVEAYIDADQVRQVIWNLLKNALQVAPKGSTIRIAVAPLEHAGVEVTVSDEGPGVPADTRGRLFETFFSGRAHGVGLGLALVKQIAVAHGGDVEVESHAGRGATFRVTLRSGGDGGADGSADAP